MNPLVRVKEAAAAVAEAEQEQWEAVRAAVAAGIPATRVAAAAGVDRSTVARWAADPGQRP